MGQPPSWPLTSRPAGLTLILWPDSSARQVAIELWYRVGGLNEKTGTTGLAHLFEHMMLRPSKFAPEGGLAFERTLGAAIGAATRFKTTNFHVSLGTENLEAMLRYYADTMKNQPIDAVMLKNEKEAVRSEYLIWDNTPFMITLPELTKYIYPGHIAENFLTGKRADLDRITIQDCLDFYRKYYSPNNAVLVIAGKFDTGKTLAWVEQYFGPVARGAEAVIPEDLKTLPKDKIVKVTTPGDSFPAAIGYPIPFGALSSSENSALDMAFQIAFDGATSLVGSELIDRRKTASAVESHIIDLGFNFVTLYLTGNHGEDVVRSVDNAVAGIQRLDEAQYRRFAFATQSNLLRSLQSPAQRAKSLGFYYTHRNGIASLQADLTATKSLPLSQVKSAAQKFLNPKHRIAILAQPSRGKK